jgi:bacterioferritin-associated ferredoxin
VEKEVSETARLTAAINSGDFERWLKESGVRADCAQCGHEEWSVIADVHKSTGLAIINRGAVDIAEYVPLIAMVCAKCGYVRSHALQSFINWADKEGGLKDARDADQK